jgi:hypothetical protein
LQHWSHDIPIDFLTSGWLKWIGIRVIDYTSKCCIVVIQPISVPGVIDAVCTTVALESMYSPDPARDALTTSSAITPAAASSYPYSPEPLGQVPASNFPQRRAVQHSAYGYAQSSHLSSTTPNYGASPLPAAAAYSPYGYGIATAATPVESAVSAASSKPALYAHNLATAALILPALMLMLHGHESVYPTTVLLFFSLTIYALDLSNQRHAVVYATWTAVPVMTCLSGWFWLMEHKSGNISSTASDNNSGWIIVRLLSQMGIAALVWTAAACWLSLQMQWLVVVIVKQPSSTTTSLMARQLESCLHGTLPIAASCVGTSQAVRWISDYQGRDVAATVAPLLFAALVVGGMVLVGSCTSSFLPNSTSHESSDNNKSKTLYCISQTMAFAHATLLLLAPPLMHMATFWKRLFSSVSTNDDWCDWLMSLCIPYLLLAALGILHQSNMLVTPYGSLRLTAATMNTSTSALAHGLFQIGATLATSLALQQRYLIPLAHSFSYTVLGVTTPSWALSVYWTSATIALLAAGWLWGRTSTITGQLLLGEYQEDFVQLLLALTGLAIGKGCGAPWNFTPLPILAFLGLSIWLTTKMLRYLVIFLFVLHATAFVTFTYRFSGIDQLLHLSFPDCDLTLMNFGMLVISGSVLIGLVAGLAVRASGGFLAVTLRRIDLAGLCLIVYTVLLLDLELSLLSTTKLYSWGWGFFTSLSLISISLFMNRVHILKASSAWTVISLAVGKLLTLYTIATFTERGVYIDERRSFFDSILTSLVFMIILAPNVFLEQVHLKISSRNKRSLAGDSELPAPVRRTLFIYCFIFLPVVVTVAVEFLFPVIDALLSQYRDDSNQIFPKIPLLLAVGVVIWSVAMLAMLHHFLPNGGGEYWQKFASLSFLVGIFLVFTASMLEWNVGYASSNPYVLASSLGATLQNRSKRRTGGWGLLSAFLASLLATTRTLELRERKSKTGVKDRFLLFRTIVFSLMFGGGATWFIVVQIMCESEWAFLVLTLISSLTIAFIGTIAGVLGYFIELENFDEVEQLAKTWIAAFPLFLAVSAIPQIARSPTAHPFGVGGWLSTYLLVVGLTALSLATSLRCRSKKDARTRGQCNLFCSFSWACFVAILYGRFGVAGLTDYNVTKVFGLAASVVGTCGASVVLLALEGDSASTGTGRTLIPSGPLRVVKSLWSLPLSQLNNSNRLFPLFFATSCVFLSASLYAIFLRGSGLFTASVIQHDVFRTMLHGNATIGINQDLATLAASSNAIFLSTKLAETSIWTSKGVFGPMFHLACVTATLPSFLLSTQKWWWRHQRRGGGNSSGIQHFQQSVPVYLLLVTASLNLLPLTMCHGIPSLPALASLNLFAGCTHVLAKRQADHSSNMQL